MNGTGGGGAGGSVGGNGGSGIVILKMLRGAGSFSINVGGDSSPGNGFCFETNVLYQENNQGTVIPSYNWEFRRSLTATKKLL